ncbi:glycoside hydrolase family 5 protein [Mycena maculata]|uniref:glucan 1,3-beta-glucosidase n=1 Tax=Mycena maculata TaxID=230809 RepID=A0AAD7NWB8_9AGAR|nr:glycoside hydrolase family 5 protein [Mycena maculata]
MQERENAAPIVSPPPTSYFDLPIPQPAYASHSIAPSTASPTDSYRDDPGSTRNSALLLPPSPKVPAALEGSSYAPHATPTRNSTKTRRWAGFGLLVTVLVVLAVVLPVYFLVIKRHTSNAVASPSTTSSSSGSGADSTGGDSGNATAVVGAVTGGDGSTVITANGDRIADPTDPFLSGARPNSWTPALNESWTWGVDHVYGVNLGGWFVLEPFIAPALFEAYPSAGDEWDLSTLMRADGTLQATLEAHYDTFITEEDIAQIAGAGLNWVRLPIPFWAIATWSDVGTDGSGPVAEPFLEGVAWQYIVRLFGWARKYGIRVNLDLHTIPGSQNGYNHSGKRGQINFLNGLMGVANAQRALDYIRIIAEFISQPEYQDVVQLFGIVNEARMAVIGRDELTAFYLQAHDTIRAITGVGAGRGAFIGVHDGFEALSSWAGFLPGADRVVLDTHPYFAFNGQPDDAPIATGTGADPAGAGGPWPRQACSAWGSSINASRSAFGVTVAGEFSNGYNDCGLYLTGVNGTQTYGGDCALWMDAAAWNATVKAGVMQFARASMDAMQDRQARRLSGFMFFWTWKIGIATDGVVRAPLWSYQLGLAGGWMPADPRTANGTCAALGVAGAPFAGTFSAWRTGGAGAGTIAAAATAQFGQWPPLTIANVPSGARALLPTYTATGRAATLAYVTPAASVTGSLSAAVGAAAPTVGVGDGWADAGDTAPGVTAVAGCTYPDAWSALSSPAPTALCTGA